MFEAEVDFVDLDAAFAGLEAEFTEIVRGISVVAWNNLLAITPQFYGRMAASWTYSLNQPVFEDRTGEVWDTNTSTLDRGPFQGYYQGHQQAVAMANAFNDGREMQFKLGDTIYFSNGVGHAEIVESGELFLRSVNRPGRPLARTFDKIAQDLSWMGARRAEVMKTLRIGE